MFLPQWSNAYNCKTDCDNACETQFGMDYFCRSHCLIEKELDCKVGVSGCDVWRANPNYEQLRIAIKLAKEADLIRSERHCRGAAEDTISLSSKLLTIMGSGATGFGQISTHMAQCACTSVRWDDDSASSDDDAPVQAGVWRRKPGLAMQIATNRSGQTWALGLPMGQFGYPVYRWGGKDWLKTSGEGLHLAIQADGKPWVVNNKDEIWRLTDQGFVRVAGAAKDIGISSRGHLWVVGNDREPFGFGLHELVERHWVKRAGSGTKVAVGDDGEPWIVNNKDEIYHAERGAWHKQIGTARDIAVGDSGTWIIGTDEYVGPDRATLGHGIYHFNEDRKNWDKWDGAATSIAVGNDRVWVTNAKNHIYRRKIR